MPELSIWGALGFERAVAWSMDTQETARHHGAGPRGRKVPNMAGNARKDKKKMQDDGKLLRKAKPHSEEAAQLRNAQAAVRKTRSGNMRGAIQTRDSWYRAWPTPSMQPSRRQEATGSGEGTRGCGPHRRSFCEYRSKKLMTKGTRQKPTSRGR